ncbi:MAG: putative sulfate exporter family transporter [Deltaproteobacteria bacterium]|nr:putative sulfate exporter family transporter [Deltaproteobacteria bacterium]
MFSGIVFCIIIAVLSFMANRYVYNRISALLWAFVFSIGAVNIIPPSEKMLKGANYSASNLLKFSIAILGLTISALAWIQMGWIGLIEVLAVVTFAIVCGLYLGKLFGLSDRLGLLIAGGTGICGCTAIAAIGPAIDAKEEEIGMAVACVTLFGLIVMFLYPYLFTSTIVGSWLHHSEIAFGVFCGTAIHETAQVVGAAAQVSDKAMAMGMVAKSIRIFSIAPVVIILAAIFHHKQGVNENNGKLIPLFAIAFVVFTLLNSVLLTIAATKGPWSAFSLHYLKPVVKFFLAVSFAGVGAKVRFKSFASLGLKAFLTGFGVAALTAVFAFILVVFVYMPTHGI